MENFVPKFLRREPWLEETKVKLKEFKIGSQIREELRNEIKDTLVRNRVTFAQSQDELPRVKRSLVEHNLNINPTVKLVRQKLRPLSLERRKAILEEILKLKN